MPEGSWSLARAAIWNRAADAARSRLHRPRTNHDPRGNLTRQLGASSRRTGFRGVVPWMWCWRRSASSRPARAGHMSRSLVSRSPRLTDDPSRPDEWTLDARDDARHESHFSSNSIHRCTAPEQLQNQPPDSRSDVYAVGVILYRLLCSRYPFRSTDRTDLRREIIEDAPQPPRQLAHDIPPELERLCLRLLAKEPLARPANGEELERELRSVLAVAEPMGPSLGHSTATRQTTAAARERELLLVLTWDFSSTTGRLQQALRDDIERRHGRVVLQTEAETVARLAPVDGLPMGMPTLLHHALSLLAESHLDGTSVWFSLDSAETDSLKHRAPRLNGRISTRGLELSPPSMDVVRRWFPCRACDDSFTRFEAEVGPRTIIRISVGDEERDPNSRSATGWPHARILHSQAAGISATGMGQIVVLIGEEGTGRTPAPRTPRPRREFTACLSLGGVDVPPWQRRTALEPRDRVRPRYPCETGYRIERDGRGGARRASPARTLAAIRGGMAEANGGGRADHLRHRRLAVGRSRYARILARDDRSGIPRADTDDSDVPPRVRDAVGQPGEPDATRAQPAIIAARGGDLFRDRRRSRAIGQCRGATHGRQRRCSVVRGRIRAFVATRPGPENP